MVDGAHGDWKTEFVEYRKQRDDRNYIMVSLLYERVEQYMPHSTLVYCFKAVNHI